ncbi:MAG TPA: hypothetical protein QF353_01515 [Gammaproteobacteria bacterium]|nr:hypothetical protein [Gammaproteobacteria bacterium]
MITNNDLPLQLLQLKSDYETAGSTQDYNDILEKLNTYTHAHAFASKLQDLCHAAKASLSFAKKLATPQRLRKHTPSMSTTTPSEKSAITPLVKKIKKKRKRIIPNPFSWYSPNCPSYLWVKAEWKHDLVRQGVYQGWHGATIQEVNIDKQSMEISNIDKQSMETVIEEWNFNELIKFKHYFQATNPELTTSSSSSITIKPPGNLQKNTFTSKKKKISRNCNLTVKIPEPNLTGFVQQGSVASSSSSQITPSIVHDHKTSPSLQHTSLQENSLQAASSKPARKRKKRFHFSSSQRNTAILTAQHCLSELKSSINFQQYIQQLKHIENWQDIARSAFEEYHLIKVDGMNRVKTTPERTDENQQPLNEAHVKMILQELSFEFLSQANILAYNKKISLIDLLCQTESWDVINAAIPDKVSSIHDVAWMHFAMSNSNQNVAINLASKFKDHAWTVNNLPPALFYYFIEKQNLDQVPENFQTFLSILFTKTSLSYLYESNGGSRSLFIDFIHDLANSNSRLQLREQLIHIFNNIYEGDQLLEQWIYVTQHHPCAKETFIFMAKILIEHYNLNLKGLHQLAYQYLHSQQNDVYTRLTIFLKDLGENTLETFKTNNQIHQDNINTQWVTDATITTDSGLYYQVVLKDIPHWHMTPQIERINRHLALKYQAQPNFFSSWVKSVRIHESFLTISPLSPSPRPLQIVRENHYPDTWVQDLYSELGHDMNSETMNMDDLRHKVNKATHRLRSFFFNKGICSDPIVKKIHPIIEIIELFPPTPNSEVKISLKIMFTYKINGQSTQRQMTFKACKDTVRQRIIAFIRTQIINITTTHLLSFNLEPSENTITIDGHQLIVSESAIESSSGASSSQQPALLRLSLDQLASKQEFSEIKMRLIYRKLCNKLPSINNHLKSTGLKLDLERLKESKRIRITLHHDTIQSINFTVDPNDASIQKFEEFCEIIEIMIANKFTASQILGHHSVPLSYVALPKHIKLNRGFEWSQCQFTDDFEVTVTRYPSELKIPLSDLKNGLKKITEGIEFNLGEHYPLTWTDINAEGAGLGCGHLYTLETLKNAFYTIVRSAPTPQNQYKKITKVVHAPNNYFDLAPALIEEQCIDGQCIDGQWTPVNEQENPPTLVGTSFRIKVQINQEPFKANDIMTHIQGAKVNTKQDIPLRLRLCYQCQRQVVPTETSHPLFDKQAALAKFSLFENQKNGNRVQWDVINGKQQISTAGVIDLSSSNEEQQTLTPAVNHNNQAEVIDLSREEASASTTTPNNHPFKIETVDLTL